MASKSRFRNRDTPTQSKTRVEWHRTYSHLEARPNPPEAKIESQAGDRFNPTQWTNAMSGMSWGKEDESTACIQHFLCTKCQAVFDDSALLQLEHGWGTSGDRPVTETSSQPPERYAHHPTLQSLEDSVRLRCHFCTLLKEMLTRDGSFQRQDHDRPETIWLTISKPRDKLYIAVECECLPFIVDDTWMGLNITRNISELMDAPNRGRSFQISLSDGENHDDIALPWEKKDPDLIPLVDRLAMRQLSTSSEAHMALATFWLQECLDKHSNCDYKVSSFTPRRLIYVGTEDYSASMQLLVDDEITPGVGYCTLSHCWGGADTLTLTSSNEAVLRQKIMYNDLPKTFRDAITITRSIGHVYLWIDSLCIIQDSVQDWFEQAAVMGEVYANSVLTIAASAAPNSHEGLFMERDPLTYTPCKLTDSAFVLPYKMAATIESETSQAPLATRGWCYQEQLLSRRMLSFCRRGMYWSCYQGDASESDPEGWGCHPHEDIPRGWFLDKINGPNVVFANWIPYGRMKTEIEKLSIHLARPNDRYVQNFDHVLHAAWYRIVSSYCQRALTKPHDKLVAISGVVQRILKDLDFRYLAGLWEKSLINDLAWAVGNPLPDRPVTYRAPSWSWASVDGDIISCAGGGYEQAMIEVVEAYTVTHESDVNHTGQVSDGYLKIRGRIKRVDTVSERKKAEIQARYLYHHLLDVSHQGRLLGFIRQDFLSIDCDNVHLVPLLRTFNAEGRAAAGIEKDKGGPLDPKFQSVIGLALVPRKDGYERIGLFEFNNRNPQSNITEWFDDAAMQEILVR